MQRPYEANLKSVGPPKMRNGSVVVEGTGAFPSASLHGQGPCAGRCPCARSVKVLRSPARSPAHCQTAA